MKVLTATSSGATREDDFCHAVEGEIVLPSVVCDSRTCGCDRAFGGLNSHQATTTIMVRDLDLTVEDLVAAAFGYLESAGWADLLRSDVVPEEPADPVAAYALELLVPTLVLAAQLDPGVIIRVAYNRRADAWEYAVAS
ncbi:MULTISPECIES: DUF7715 family protein [Gordonia]|jgi:hypothetical protein|uniref:DUF7715 domain-containing protein n=2 Tax=Gordonia alkanivorans TaxID=84096 RepID=F9W1S1_9ACTN|nr:MULTISPECIES: hypothetical protein [Gordonia]AZZ82540.1 hypothetical protein C5O27_16980 [Gordonia alkanivorans]ETA05362.1 hypothetical protein V525_17940 [Gordonia alkanivorans CGMCC 6845]MDH3006969.1 hypothetical protein [Gordonia alkanivorans]MDH3011882.1 hypothetical protein [Gordonia alkanivorans]MDH3018088.1 hypothetical protein [Gordonia alkanivorans]